jgi:DNA end-binding protein Ku
MPRPAWTGSITFGMVTIPVRLVPAVRRKTVSFNQLDSETLSRIRYRKVAEATGEEVPAERIVKAAEVARGEYVVITDDELEPLAPERSQQIALETFVPQADVDPTMFDASYHVVPDKAPKPYALLAQAMAGTDRVAIGRFVMRQKEYLAAIRSDGERLMVSTLVFPDELVPAESIPEFDSLESVEVNERELGMARSLVDALSEEFAPEQYVDEYRAAVEELIASKAAGKAIEPVVATPRPAAVVDLAAALEASLKEAKATRERHPTARTASRRAAPATDEAAEAVEATARKPRARARKSA